MKYNLNKVEYIRLFEDFYLDFIFKNRNYVVFFLENL